MVFVLSTSNVFSVLLVFLVLNCFTEFRSDAQSLLPEEEVQTLQTISAKLNYIGKYWNISRSSCSQSPGFNRNISDGILSNVTCDCSFHSSTVCHVTNIQLKGLNLSGVLPAEFGNLTHLQELDLTRNYINGSIPESLARLPNLTILSLLGNRISGNIPEKIGNITTLEQLVLEDNHLGGPLPQSIGNLSSLKRLILSGNNFNGSIPETFGNLKNLEDFRIDGSRISGKIPDIIGNLTQIRRLDLQGTSMEGPIPSTMSRLRNLEELRISDLSESSSIPFPDLQNLKNLQRLVLRNCLITGSIPEYIGGWTNLKLLDLSFNKLTGPIPPTIATIRESLNYLFLSNNSLSGEVPSWDSFYNGFDVSYNNFNRSLTTPDCQSTKVNLVSSYSSLESDSIAWCLRKDLPCLSKSQYHSLFINCGGPNMTFEDNEYEGDLTQGGASYFYTSPTNNWAYSSTGVFTDNILYGRYIATNELSLDVMGGVYQTARLAPTSLKYYGLCLQKGSYRVQLHFAEIMFSDDQTYTSLGRRIFDVSIQGNVVLKDFDIAEEAKGVRKGITMDFPNVLVKGSTLEIHLYWSGKAKGVVKGITKTFPNVLVKGSTLEIHLYWSGKGTTAIPDRGVYGPLISAITVTPNYDVDKGQLVGAIVGIVAASCLLLVLLLVFLRMKGKILAKIYSLRIKTTFGGKYLEDKELCGLELQIGYFTLRQIKDATRNFDPGNKIGEGGFGPVYKGVLSDGTIIAAKQLSSKSKQGNREFLNEIGMISTLQHPNLVRLYGCCIEGNQLLLIYEYMENNSLARALFGREEHRLNLGWPTRQKICLGIARGLAYLHEKSRLKIIHRDIKATNVLLDKDLNAKISDFGLAKLDEEENTHISTRIAGTLGYMAPEYAMRGYLTDKADVYSFGIVALEIVCGKSITNYKLNEEFVYLLDWDQNGGQSHYGAVVKAFRGAGQANVLQEQGNILELVDPCLDSNYNEEEAMRMLNLALLCTNPSSTLRPSMSSVVSMLEGKSAVQAPKINRSSINEDMRFKAFEELSHDSQTDVSTCSQNSQVQKSKSMDGSRINSSVSLQSKDETQDHSSSSKILQHLYDVSID